MLRIQQLITDKMLEGKSMSRMAEEAGVTKTSIHNYYHGKAKPEGKSLALLSKYFKIPVEDLLDRVGDRHGDVLKTSDEWKLLEKSCADLSQDELLEVVLMVRKLKQGRTSNQSGPLGT